MAQKSCHIEAGKWALLKVLKVLENAPFLGPRGPLRTPLMSVVVPSSATKIHATSHYSFPSDSKLKQPLPQYTVYRTLNRIISRAFLAQFGLVFLQK